MFNKSLVLINQGNSILFPIHLCIFINLNFKTFSISKTVQKVLEKLF